MKKFYQAITLSFLLTFWFFAFSGFAADERITIGEYNMENLHDIAHDEGKDDWEWLPKDYPGKHEHCMSLSDERARKRCLESDWTKEKFELKMGQIKKGLEAIGRRVHILVATEVDNERAVEPLAKSLGYGGWVVSHSPDERGMNVAILYDTEHPLFQFVSNIEHQLQGREFETKPTRNINEGQFKLINGQTLHVFGNHWPSQGAPAPVRLAAAEILAKIVESRVDLNPDALIFSLGDLNVIEGDRPDPLFQGLTRPDRKYPLREVDLDYRAMVRNQSRNNGHDRSQSHLPGLDKIPPGTYFYGPTMSWNVLDKMHYLPKMNLELNPAAEVYVDLASYKIGTSPFMKTDYRYGENPWDCDDYLAGSVVRGIPKRYDFRANTVEGAGYSDHFPVAVDLVIRR